MTADNTTELEVKLETMDLGYLVSIKTDQVGDSLYVDDNFVGVSPQELYFELGSYQIEAKRGMAIMERTLKITENLRKDETLDVLIEIKEYDFVDLGLSVKWATCNVGASVPEEYGHCYTWGETMFKDEYVLDNCTTCRDTINEISGSATHDVARVNCGKKWRIPTKDEMAELKDRCQWTWTEKNGVKGYEITGPNGNTIFMPAAGNYMGSTRYNAGIGGLYWTATSPTTEKGNAYYLHFDVDRNIISADRYYGLAIRPVID
ncbi:MAG: PEGA domain-containing protein [Bacteroidales bacterium]|nr:PEGA domain-containing protein [Bacteroidales bacterium]